MIFLTILCIAWTPVSLQRLCAQGHTPVFPMLEGDALIDALQEEYSPTEYLSYSDARDTLFARIYARDDSLSGIFTDHTLYLDPALDPTQAVFMNGQPDGINTEHLWPQSKGAGEPPARMDMHNLYPARVAVNSDRASLPFLEIDDQETVEWYYKDRSMSSIPIIGIDRYSERSEEAFEPRESIEGNVARTLLYFKVIYEDVADMEFFEQQRETLCTWHEQDPVDSLEWVQNEAKAQYQGNLNPFILDCSLAKRAFCPTLPSCTVSADHPQLLNGTPTLHPNPTDSGVRLKFQTDRTVHYSVQIQRMTGQLIHDSGVKTGRGSIEYSITIEQAPPGIYQLILLIRTNDQLHRQRLKLIKI